jgi:hypothetical protein
MHLRDERLKIIESEIEQLGIFANQLRDSALDLMDLQNVRDWRNQFQRLYARFEGTPFQEELDIANEQVARLQELIIELDSLSKKTPTTMHEAKATYDRLKLLREKNEPWISIYHKQAIERASNRLGTYVQQRIEETRAWCERLEKQLATGELQKVIEALKMPPAFIPETEKKRIEALQLQVQEHLDQDIVAKIEAQFRQIADPSVRQKCLDRLSAITQDNSTS